MVLHTKRCGEITTRDSVVGTKSLINTKRCGEITTRDSVAYQTMW